MTSGKEGGTWLGISRFGNIGMLTNYRSKSDLKNPNNPSNSKSRGNIVSDFLINRPSPSDYINGLIHGNDVYSTFNTLIADFDWKISNFRFFYGNNVKGCVEELSEGIHSLTNAEINCPWTKASNGKKIFAEILSNEDIEKDQLMEDLFSLLLQNDQINFPNHGGSALDLPEELVPHLSSIFVKTPEKYHYGTRTSSVILVDDQHKVTFVEKTMSDPMNLADPKWQTRKTEFLMIPPS